MSTLSRCASSSVNFGCGAGCKTALLGRGACMCACVCVCEREQMLERVKERGREGERKGGRE